MRVNPTGSILGRAAREREEQENQQVAQLCDALSHATRVEIARLLRERGAMTCSAIVAQFPLAQSTISQHLKTMRDAELVEYTPSGAYQLNEASLQSLRDALTQL